MNAPRRTLLPWVIWTLSTGFVLSAAPALGQAGRFYANHPSYNAGLKSAQTKGYLRGEVVSRSSSASRGPSLSEYRAKLNDVKRQIGTRRSEATSHFGAYGHTKNRADLRAGQRATVQKNELKLKELKLKQGYQKAKAAAEADPKKAARYKANAKELNAKATALKQQIKTYREKSGLKPSGSSKPNQPSASPKKVGTQMDLDQFADQQKPQAGAERKVLKLKQTKLNVKPRPAGGSSSGSTKPSSGGFVTLPGGQTIPIPGGLPQQSPSHPQSPSSPQAPGEVDSPIMPGMPPANLPGTTPGTTPGPAPSAPEIPPPATVKEAGARARFQLATRDFAGLEKTMVELDAMPKSGIMDRLRAWNTKRQITGSRLGTSLPLIGRLLPEGGLVKMAKGGAKNGDPGLALGAADTLAKVRQPGFWTSRKLRGIARTALKGARADSKADRPDDAINRYLAASSIQELAGGKGVRGTISSWRTKRAINGNLRRDINGWSKEGNLDAFNRGEAAIRDFAEIQGRPLTPKEEAKLEKLAVQAVTRSADRALNDANNMLDGKIPYYQPEDVLREAATRIQYAAGTADTLRSQGFAVKSGRIFKNEGKFDTKLRKVQAKLDRYVQSLNAQTGKPTPTGLRGWIWRNLGAGRKQPPPVAPLPQPQPQEAPMPEGGQAADPAAGGGDSNTPPAGGAAPHQQQMMMQQMAGS